MRRILLGLIVLIGMLGMGAGNSLVYKNFVPHLSKVDFNILMKGMVYVESSNNPECVGPKGERGLTQQSRRNWHWVTKHLMKVNWDFDKYAFCPKKNRAVGEAELKFYLRRLKNWKHAILAYNCGLKRFRDGKTPKASYYHLKKVDKKVRKYLN